MEIPTGYAQANLMFTGNGVPTGAQITLGMDRTGYASDPAQAAQDVFENWSDSGVMSNVSDDVVFSGVLVKFGPVATGPSALYSDVHNGGISGECAPPSVAFLVHKNTAFGGRSGSGRFYIPGVPEAGVTVGGALAGTYQADVQADMDGFVAAQTAGDLPLVLLHSDDSPAPNPYPITSLGVDAKVATQRRRLRR